MLYCIINNGFINGWFEISMRPVEIASYANMMHDYITFNSLNLVLND